MIKDFIISFKLKNAYRVNGFIYSIKQLPIIKKIVTFNFYSNEGLKIFGNIISAIIEIIEIFLGKFVYLALFFLLPIAKLNLDKTSSFLNILLFLTIAGTVMNTFMFNPSKDKYYAMILMRMNAKKYTLSNFTYSILKIIVGFMPFAIIFGLICDINIFICLLIPFFIASLKIIVSTFFLYDYKKNKRIFCEASLGKKAVAFVTINLLLAYGLIFLKITVNEPTFVVISAISIITSIFCIKYIKNFNLYGAIYKRILKNPNEAMEEMNFSVKETYHKTIDEKTIVKSNKTGFEYLNDIFVQRHRKILETSSKRTAIGILVIFAALIVITFINNDIKSQVNNFVLKFLPYFVFIMYLINRGDTITKALFMNCDHSLLTYSFYKKPETILKMFRIRLKSVIKINLIPAFVLALGLPTLLYITGGTDNSLNYLVLFVSIISMSIFFSIHHLVLYYLLQPYNINLESRSTTYTMFNTITYAACYMMLRVQIPTIKFGIAMIAFTIIYSIVSLILIYKYAPKTFKLRN